MTKRNRRKKEGRERQAGGEGKRERGLKRRDTHILCMEVKKSNNGGKRAKEEVISFESNVLGKEVLSRQSKGVFRQRQENPLNYRNKKNDEMLIYLPGFRIR